MKGAMISLFLIFSLVTYNNADETINCMKEELGCSKSQVYACEMENEINALVETIRKLLQNGDPDKNIPSFDPFEIPELTLNLSSHLISGNMEISNLELKGVTDFIKTKGCLAISVVRPTVLELGVRFDKIVLNTGYNGNVNIMDMVNIFGTGIATITLKDFSVNIYAAVKPLKPRIVKIEVALVLPSTIDVKFTGLLHDERMSDIISRQLTDTLQTLAKEEEERINKILNELIAKLIENAQKPKETSNVEEEEEEENTFENVIEVLQETLKEMLTKKDFIVRELTKKYLEEY